MKKFQPAALKCKFVYVFISVQEKSQLKFQWKHLLMILNSWID